MKVKQVNSTFLKNFAKRRDMSAILATFLLAIIFSTASSSFFSSYNIFNMSRTASLYMLEALAQAFALIVGGMNLSIGGIGALTVVTFGCCMEGMGMPSGCAIVVALLVGCLCGLINGFIISKLKLNAFIVTLATNFIFNGLVTGISRGYPYKTIGSVLEKIGQGKFLGLPYLFYIMLIFIVFLWFFFKYTVLGRKLLATGGNINAARLSGINTDNMIIYANVLSGLFAALAGIMWTARNGAASPTTGSDWMMISFAVAALGGTALSGGEISAIGLGFAAFLMTFIKNGLVMVNADIYFEDSFLGVIILLAVCLETIRMKYIKRK